MGANRKLKRAARPKKTKNAKTKATGPTTRGKAARGTATTTTSQATTRTKRIAGHQRAAQARTQAKRDAR